MHTTRWLPILLTACTLMACGEKVYDNPFDVDNDGDGLVAAYDCDDKDATVGKCVNGDYCKYDTQCDGSVCVEGVCTCEILKLTKYPTNLRRAHLQLGRR